jgi:hypothetical protein
VAASINPPGDCGAALIFHRIGASETPICVLIEQRMPAAVAPERQILTVERRVGAHRIPFLQRHFYRFDTVQKRARALLRASLVPALGEP